VQELRLRDFALVPAAAVSLGPGLVAISGQSGAGKSVLLDALGQLLGAAAAADCVRPPAEVAVVEGSWWCGPAAAAAAGALLRELGLPARALPGGEGGSSSSGSSGGVIHIRREVRAQQRVVVSEQLRCPSCRFAECGCRSSGAATDLAGIS
jgi:hypothetical protein